MKKSWIILIAVLCLIIPSSYALGAELAKQGEETIRMAHTGNYRLLTMGNDRSEAVFEAAGLVVDAPAIPHSTKRLTWYLDHPTGLRMITRNGAPLDSPARMAMRFL